MKRKLNQNNKKLSFLCWFLKNFFFFSKWEDSLHMILFACYIGRDSFKSYYYEGI